MGGLRSFQNIDIPFLASIKVSHHWTSPCICQFNLTSWFGPLLEGSEVVDVVDEASSRSHYFCSVLEFPASDCSFLFVAVFLPCHVFNNVCCSRSWCLGRDGCISTVSTVMPRISNRVASPSNFSLASGTPKRWHSFVRNSKSLAQ